MVGWGEEEQGSVGGRKRLRGFETSTQAKTTRGMRHPMSASYSGFQVPSSSATGIALGSSPGWQIIPV